MTEFTIELENATQTLLNAMKHSVSLLAGCELFKRLVTRTAGDTIEVGSGSYKEFDVFKNRLIERARNFTEKAPRYREKISEIAYQFIKDDCTVLLHSYSRSVTTLLLKAAVDRKFRVLITEAKPHSMGFVAARILNQAGIPASVILDASVGYYIDKVDLVLVGAEGVVENGGLINQIGTYQIAVMSKAANRPFYAVAESYKFVRFFPLNQYDLPSNASCNSSVLSSDKEKDAYWEQGHPTIDYTPPEYLTLLFTDLGVFTPSGLEWLDSSEDREDRLEQLDALGDLVIFDFKRRALDLDLGSAPSSSEKSTSSWSSLRIAEAAAFLFIKNAALFIF